jgi:arabinose-5-phosphate isomerase
LIEITGKKLGLTLVLNKKKIVGVFTDGDLRRCLNDGVDINNTAIKDVMTITFKSIESNALAIDAAEMMEKNKIFSLVVNSSTHREDTIGIITMHQLLEAGII